MHTTKYQKVNKKENEILIDAMDPTKTDNKTFDFSSIYDYKSIYSYSKPNAFLKYNSLNLEQSNISSKKQEKFINFVIMGICYLIFFIFLPFSLIFCLKKVKQNENMVVYRLGRLIHPAYQPGYYLLFPFIDSYKRHNVVQKELCIPNLQIITFETSIIDLSTVIRYKIDDIIKMTNSLQDSNTLLRSISRGILISIASKKDTNKIESDKMNFTLEFKNTLNETVKKWGIEIIDIEILINGIVKNENSDGEDPALKTLSMVFKSLFSSASNSKSDTTTGTSDSITQGSDFISLVQSMMQLVNPQIEQNEITKTTSEKETFSQADHFSQYEPFKLLKIIEPLITENLVKEINTVYEFHLIRNSNNPKKENECEVFHLDIKNNVKHRVSIGECLFSKTDCVIKISEESLNDLLNENLKPFAAYLSGKIDIEGDLNDVLKLKKLIKLIPTNLRKA
ncbi:stomatin 1 isoform X2 [Brachionus plicatilis]|uniref:Stomatin 1 isoform X2 n=1 Tax=Brachionus plicatilis TaxID=10195 RepID=A0A3M7QQR0_BRAPC|nr:stomatin 1 isoform X2 [Brachionus plicatilis]